MTFLCVSVENQKNVVELIELKSTNHKSSHRYEEIKPISIYQKQRR